MLRSRCPRCGTTTTISAGAVLRDPPEGKGRGRRGRVWWICSTCHDLVPVIPGVLMLLWLACADAGRETWPATADDTLSTELAYTGLIPWLWMF